MTECDKGLPFVWTTGEIPIRKYIGTDEYGFVLIPESHAEDHFKIYASLVIDLLSDGYTPEDLFQVLVQELDDVPRVKQFNNAVVVRDGTIIPELSVGDFYGFLCPTEFTDFGPLMYYRVDYSEYRLHLCDDPQGWPIGWSNSNSPGEIVVTPEIAPYGLKTHSFTFSNVEGINTTLSMEYAILEQEITNSDIIQQYARAFRDKFGNNPEDPWYCEHSGVHDPYWDNVWSLVHFEEYSDKENSVLLCEKGKTLVATNETGEHLSEDYGVFGKGWTSLLVEGGQYAQLEYEETIPYEDFAVSTIEFRYRKTEEVGSHYAIAYGGGMIQVNSPTNNILGFSSPGGSVNALSPINIGQYYDICVVFDTDVAYFFIDGQLQGTTGTNFFFGPEYTLAFGVETFPLGGCNIDEVRITLGVARYTDDYEVAEGPFSHGGEEEEEEEEEEWEPNTPNLGLPGRYVLGSRVSTGPAIRAFDTLNGLAEVELPNIPSLGAGGSGVHHASPDGRFIAVNGITNSPNGILIIDTLDWSNFYINTPVGTVTTVGALQFSPDSKYLVAGILGVSASERICLYNTKDWERMNPLESSPGTTKGCIAFSPDGTKISIGSGNGSGQFSKVYHFPSFEEIPLTYPNHAFCFGTGWYDNETVLFQAQNLSLSYFNINDGVRKVASGGGNSRYGASVNLISGLVASCSNNSPYLRKGYFVDGVLSVSSSGIPNVAVTDGNIVFSSDGTKCVVVQPSISQQGILFDGEMTEVLGRLPSSVGDLCFFDGEIRVGYLFSVDNEKYSKFELQKLPNLDPVASPLITDTIVAVSFSSATNEMVIQVESESKPFRVYTFPTLTLKEISPEIPGDAHFESSAGSGNKNGLSRDGSLYVAQLGGLKTYIYDTDDWSLKATIEDAGYFADFVYSSDDLSSPPVYLVFTKDVDFTSTDINVFDVAENDFVPSLYVNVPLRRDIFGPSLNKAENLLFSFRDNDNVAHAVRMFGALHGTPIAFPSNFPSNQSFLNKEGNILYMNGTDETKAYDVSSGVTLLGTIEGVTFEDMVFGPDGSTAYAIVAEEE